jgi:hypothetical protein
MDEQQVAMRKKAQVSKGREEEVLRFIGEGDNSP